MTCGKHYAVATSILLLLFSITSAAGQPVDQAPGDTIPENPSEQAPENISNKTGQGPLSKIPGLNNETLPVTISPPEMPDLPVNASNVARSVTSTIGEAFGSAVDGIGSFLSANLPVISGPEQPGDNINSTNSTQ